MCLLLIYGIRPKVEYNISHRIFVCPALPILIAGFEPVTIKDVGKTLASHDVYSVRYLEVQVRPTCIA